MKRDYTNAALIAGAWSLVFLGQAHPAFAGEPVVRVECDAQHPEVRVLSWDTEGGNRAQTNLLRTNQPLRLRVHVAGQWKSAADSLSKRTALDGQEIHYQVSPAD